MENYWFPSETGDVYRNRDRPDIFTVFFEGNVNARSFETIRLFIRCNYARSVSNGITGTSFSFDPDRIRSSITDSRCLFSVRGTRKKEFLGESSIRDTPSHGLLFEDLHSSFDQR